MASAFNAGDEVVDIQGRRFYVVGYGKDDVLMTQDLYDGSLDTRLFSSTDIREQRLRLTSPEVELTLAQIADKFNISIGSLRIKEDK